MAAALATRLRRLLPSSPTRVPERPRHGEVAATSIAGRLQPYIGELPLNPRQPSRYADRHRDEGQALRTYRDILRDERCQAALDQRLDAAIARPWTVEPGGDGPDDRMAADDLARQLEGVGFDAVSRQLLHGVWYGYAIAEALWARAGDRVVLDRLAVRAPDRFRWSAEGQPLLRTDAHPLGEPLPDAKFVILRRPGEHGDLPHGPGLARWCYWPVWLKRNGLKFWSVALEKFGAPGVKGHLSEKREQRAEGRAAGPGPILRHQPRRDPCPRARRSRSSRVRAGPAATSRPSSPTSTAPSRPRSSGSPPPPTWGPGAAPPRCSATCATRPSPPTAACSTTHSTAPSPAGSPSGTSRGAATPRIRRDASPPEAPARASRHGHGPRRFQGFEPPGVGRRA